MMTHNARVNRAKASTEIAKRIEKTDLEALKASMKKGIMEGWLKKGKSRETFVVNKNGNIEVEVNGFPVEIKRLRERDWDEIVGVCDRIAEFREGRSENGKFLRRELQDNISNGSIGVIAAVANIEGEKCVIGSFDYYIKKDENKVGPGRLYIKPEFRGSMLGTIIVGVRDAIHRSSQKEMVTKTGSSSAVAGRLGYSGPDIHPFEPGHVFWKKKAETTTEKGKKIKRKEE